MKSAADYADQLLALLPTGKLWDDLRQDPTTQELLAAIAEELARVDASAEGLIDETDPRTVYYLLAEWEAFAGLPTECAPADQTLDQRRAALQQQLAGVGGQSIAYFIAVAARLGFTVTITEFTPANVGSAVNDPLYGADWRFAWRVNAPVTTIEAATVASGVNEPLQAWGNKQLECTINRLRPAHTTVQFAYG